MFLGPTGVGKTELAKALALSLFGDKNAMVRLDMSEYMEKHSVSRLIGSPPGYIGYGEAGQLTEKIHRRPYSLLLLDEIEKAHPDVLNLLLQIMDDGFLTDAQGRKVDFRNTIIIMTSNAGAAELNSKTKLGFGDNDSDEKKDEKAKKAVKGAVRSIFRPEFINRLDEIIVFNNLNSNDIEKITLIMLKEVADRINRLNIEIVFTDALVKFISQKGYDSTYGARQLRRTITTLIEDSFANEILSNKIKSGDKVKADINDGEIIYFSE